MAKGNQQSLPCFFILDFFFFKFSPGKKGCLLLLEDAKIDKLGFCRKVEGFGGGPPFFLFQSKKDSNKGQDWNELSEPEPSKLFDDSKSERPNSWFFWGQAERNKGRRIYVFHSPSLLPISCFCFSRCLIFCWCPSSPPPLPQVWKTLMLQF